MTYAAPSAPPTASAPPGTPARTRFNLAPEPFTPASPPSTPGASAPPRAALHAHQQRGEQDPAAETPPRSLHARYGLAAVVLPMLAILAAMMLAPSGPKVLAGHDPQSRFKLPFVDVKAACFRVAGDSERFGLKCRATVGTLGKLKSELDEPYCRSALPTLQSACLHQEAMLDVVRSEGVRARQETAQNNRDIAGLQRNLARATESAAARLGKLKARKMFREAASVQAELEAQQKDLLAEIAVENAMNTELDKHKDEHFASRSAELASNFTAAVTRLLDLELTNERAAVDLDPSRVAVRTSFMNRLHAHTADGCSVKALLEAASGVEARLRRSAVLVAEEGDMAAAAHLQDAGEVVAAHAADLEACVGDIQRTCALRSVQYVEDVCPCVLRNKCGSAGTDNPNRGAPPPLGTTSRFGAGILHELHWGMKVLLVLGGVGVMGVCAGVLAMVGVWGAGRREPPTAPPPIQAMARGLPDES